MNMPIEVNIFIVIFGDFSLNAGRQHCIPTAIAKAEKTHRIVDPKNTIDSNNPIPKNKATIVIIGMVNMETIKKLTCKYGLTILETPFGDFL